jgi:transposase-like protein
MGQFSHQNRSRTCPHCGFSRAWALRREKKKCKRCRREWSCRWKVKGFAATRRQWQNVAREFLRDRTGVRVAEQVGMERKCVHRMLHHLRTLMTYDIPKPFSGIVEVDETFIGGQWRNKPFRIRRLGTKRGHGTSKQAIFGMLSRSSGQVIATPIPNLKSDTLLSLLHAHARPTALIYTDGWTGYARVYRSFSHEQVDHQGGVYVRGTVHTNSIESFWGFLKRRLKITGGVRRDRLALFLGEETWRFNHRRLSLKEKTEKLCSLLVAE